MKYSKSMNFYRPDTDEVDLNKTYYVLNPSVDLDSTQKTFQKIFKS